MNPLPTMDLLGMKIARVDRWQLVDHLFAELAERRGGWVVTANLDFLRRHVREPDMRELFEQADVRVADGMPLLWAANLQGDPLPERVPGSSLVSLLAERAAREGRSVYLLGGDDGAAEGTATKWRARWPSIRIGGWSNPWIAIPPRPSEVEAIVAALGSNVPDILLVGLGSPKQEHLIQALRPHLPHTWMIGVGISFSFEAGMVQRAPPLMRRIGLEWVHRLGQEPRRLARRYLVDDLPFAVHMLTRMLLHRRRRSRDENNQT
jgi:N-acetylglucosaminyldiphosphoundecaprenol N-acetyl-beta-D-mannosaminyltransferase